MWLYLLVRVIVYHLGKVKNSPGFSLLSSNNRSPDLVIRPPFLICAHLKVSFTSHGLRSLRVLWIDNICVKSRLSKAFAGAIMLSEWSLLVVRWVHDLSWRSLAINSLPLFKIRHILGSSITTTVHNLALICRWPKQAWGWGLQGDTWLLILKSYGGLNSQMLPKLIGALKLFDLLSKFEWSLGFSSGLYLLGWLLLIKELSSAAQWSWSHTETMSRNLWRIQAN